MTEETEDNNKDDSLENLGLASKLLKTRTLVISEGVNSALAKKVLNQLILLEQEAPDEPITVFLNSPGGEVFSGFAIYDMLRFIQCPVTTVVAGFAASMGSVLSLAASKGRRFAFPTAKIMIHQPLLTGYQGPASDCEIQANEILKIRDLLIEIYHDATGKDREELKQVIDRDYWLTAQEALEFGLLDKVITSRDDLKF